MAFGGSTLTMVICVVRLVVKTVVRTVFHSTNINSANRDDGNRIAGSSNTLNPKP